MNYSSSLLAILSGFVLMPSAWAQTTKAPSPGLPLPAAMIRLAIPDVPAFDRALGGGFKKALYGNLPEDDGVARGFGQSQVGAKLQDQWTRFRGDTALSFQTITELQTSSAALAVLNIGNIELVLVLETPLAALPEIFATGTARIEHGRTYHVVRSGAGDEGTDGETRMGLAWSHEGGLLVIATSERAMKLALAAIASGERFSPKLDGLASLELDVHALQKDLYFKREFLFGAVKDAAEARGKINAAIRLEAGRLVEVREGEYHAMGARGATFEAEGALASGWINDASELLLELRRGVLEPVPAPLPKPQLTLAPLPPAQPASVADRYSINVEVPVVASAGSATEAAELDAWKALLDSQLIPGFGYVITPSRARLLSIPWPKERDAELASLIEATLKRRGARVTSSTLGGEVQYLMGPNLPVLAFKRSGDFIWISPKASDLRAAPPIAWSKDVIRFAKLSLTAVRDEGKRWGRLEGPRASDHVRPWSDRVLGLLGWMPAVKTLEVERRVTGTSFKERVVFGVAPPPQATPVK